MVSRLWELTITSWRGDDSLAITIDEERCKGCELCVSVGPRRSWGDVGAHQ